MPGTICSCTHGEQRISETICNFPNSGRFNANHNIVRADLVTYVLVEPGAVAAILT